MLKRLALVSLMLALPACTRDDPSTVAQSPAAEESSTPMVLIPAGEFLQGSADDDPAVYPWEKPHEQPQHPVQLAAFLIDTHEVTNVQYERFDPSHARAAQSACDRCPVTKITWDQAQAYCAAQTPRKRLPTEAEWEKAAKGGSARDPQNLGEYAWFARNSITQAQPVGQKLPNGYGLYDMLGNVREWTADWYDPTYYQQRVRDAPKGPPTGQRRVERGGAFFLPQRGVTSTIRYNHPQSFYLYFLGFRCARDAP